LPFERLLQGAHMASPPLGALVLPTRVSQVSPFGEHGVKEPPEPDALPLTAGAHLVHPVVPITRTYQRQAVNSDRQAVIERARTMLEERASVGGGARLEVRPALSNLELRSFEEGDDLVEDGAITGDLEIAGDDVRQPEHVIGDARSDAAAAGRVPPVLDVALLEMPYRRAQRVLPCQPGRGDGERHHVLKLIAKPIRAAGLIERRPRPDATGQRLVQQPAIEQNVQSAVRCPDLHRAEQLAPALTDHSQDRRHPTSPVA